LLYCFKFNLVGVEPTSWKLTAISLVLYRQDTGTPLDYLRKAPFDYCKYRTHISHRLSKIYQVKDMAISVHMDCERYRMVRRVGADKNVP